MTKFEIPVHDASLDNPDLSDRQKVENDLLKDASEAAQRLEPKPTVSHHLPTSIEEQAAIGARLDREISASEKKARRDEEAELRGEPDPATTDILRDLSNRYGQGNGSGSSAA